MEDNQKMSKAFEFALHALDIYRKVMVLVVFWSFWAIFFSKLEPTFIGNILLSAVAFGLAVMPLLVDFNESHATNPLWTGHARFHLVWQVLALTITGIIIILLLWVFPSFSNLLIIFMEDRDKEKDIPNLKFNSDNIPDDYQLLFQKLKIIKEIINLLEKNLFEKER